MSMISFHTEDNEIEDRIARIHRKALRDEGLRPQDIDDNEIIIRGRFEGQHPCTVYFWALRGEGDEYNDWITLPITQEERFFFNLSADDCFAVMREDESKGIIEVRLMEIGP